jgi:hypothetical protein
MPVPPARRIVQSARGRRKCNPERIRIAFVEIQKQYNRETGLSAQTAIRRKLITDGF